MRSGGWWVRLAMFGAAVGHWGSAPASAQGLNNVVRPSANANPSVFTPPPGLPAAYSIELASAWDRPDIVRLCAMRGGETVQGRLNWTGSSYVGMLWRETAVVECGVHGPAACTVQVAGSGEVQATATPAVVDGRNVLELRWSPARGTRIAVVGDCPAAYQRGLEQMYRTATHLVLVPAPRAGHEPVTVMLDEQPWRVKVSP